MTRARLAARMVILFAALAACGSSSGCHLLPDVRMPWGPQAPVVFQAPPTGDDIVRAVNSNSAPVRQLSSDSASVAAAGFPPLRADLAFERPRNFRMRATLLGPELDVGSNADLFWMWFKHNPQPGVFFARHDRYATSPMRQVLPLDPALVVDAFGLVQLDPLAPYDAPRSLGDHKMELRTRVPSPDGDMTRVLVVHDAYGWILEQRLYDVRGQLIATATASKHRHYPESGVSLPHHLEFNLPTAKLNLSVSVREFRINQLDGNPAQLWTLPKMDGYPLVDITDPSMAPQIAPASASGTGTNINPASQSTPMPGPMGGPMNGSRSPEIYQPADSTFRPRYRGFN